MLSSDTDLPQRDRWARLRFAIIGPLLAAPPATGDLHDALKALAAKSWRHPFTGLEMRFAVSTIERWLYAAKKAGDPVQALRNQVRRDIGRFPSLSGEAVQVLASLYREHREVRSSDAAHVLQLLHLDFPHGSRKVLPPSGAWLQPLLVGFNDARSR